MTSYHAQSGAGAARPRCSSTCAAARTSRSSPTPARPRSAIRAASWWRPGPREGGTVVPIPGASAVLAAVAAIRGGRAALGVRGLPAAIGARAPRAARPDRRRRARARSCSRRRAGSRRRSRDLAAACGPDRPGAVCRELTKLHESIVRGTLGELAAARGRRAAGSRPAASSSIVVGDWRGGRSGTDAADEADGPRRGRGAEVEALVAAGVARGDAARRVAAATGSAAPAALRRSTRLGRMAGMTAADREPARPPLPSILGQPSLDRPRSSRLLSLGASFWASACAPTRRSLFIVSAAAILGLAWVVGLSTERLGVDHGPQVGGILNRDVRQHRRADHRVLRAPGRPDRGRQGVADRLDHRQPAARARPARPDRRAPARHADTSSADRRPNARHRCSLAGCRRAGHPDAGDDARRTRRRPRGRPERHRARSSLLVVFAASIPFTLGRGRGASRELREPSADRPGRCRLALVVLVAAPPAAALPPRSCCRLDQADHGQQSTCRSSSSAWSSSRPSATSSRTSSRPAGGQGQDGVRDRP